MTKTPIVGLAAALMCLAGCSMSYTQVDIKAPESTETGPAKVTAQLQVEYQPASNVAVIEKRLMCFSDGRAVGAGLDAQGACEWLSENVATVLTEPMPDSACSMIFGGEHALRLQGRVFDEPVDELLTRANGCEIARWDEMMPLIIALTEYDPESSSGINTINP